MYQDVFLVLAVLVITYYLWSLVIKPNDMPPCPSPLPILGNLLTVMRWIRQKTMHLELQKLAKVYGGKIFRLKLPGQNIIVINSASTAREALVRKWDEFGGRPFLFTFDYFTRGSKDIAAQDFNSTLIFQRKIVHSAIRSYQPSLEDKLTLEVDNLVKRLTDFKEEPVEPLNEITLTVMNVICKMVYGDRYQFEDPEFKIILEYNQCMVPLLGPLNILNIFPFLIYFPIKDSRTIKCFVKTRDEVFNKKYHEHKQSYQEGIIRDLTDALIKALQEAEQEDDKIRRKITEDHVVMTMSDAFSAGFETTSAQILWFLFFMVRHPDIQGKVQKELDFYIGKDNMTRWEDRTRLPLISAVIEEVIRLSSIAPTLLPRKTTLDTTLEGFFIPKGTTILINAMAFHLDENEWKDPYIFNPDRFLDDDGKLIQVAGIKSFLPFGAGRRGCVGEVLAKQQLFVISTRLLQKFHLEAELSISQLSPIDGKLQGPIRYPVPFKMRFKKR